MGKPVRRVRRFLKRSYGHRFKPHRSQNLNSFLAEESDERLEAIFKGKGKGKGLKGRRRTTGFGFGRKTNPRDKQGNIMKCHGCGSEHHLIKRCPQAQSGKGQPKGDGKGNFQSSPNYPQEQTYHNTSNEQVPDRFGPVSSLFDDSPTRRISMTTPLVPRASDPNSFMASTSSCRPFHQHIYIYI